MTTDEIIGNLIFMPGRREVQIWKTRSHFKLPGLSVAESFGEYYPYISNLVYSLDAVLPFGEYVSILHRPTKGSIPRAYLFLGGDNEWLPLDHDTTENQMRGIVKRFRAETMSPSDFG
jgi:hypothetical protein